MRDKLKIKVCGMTSPENISRVAALHPDFMGFIFHESSPRSALSLPADYAVSIPDSIKRIGVFVNKPHKYVCEIMQRYGFSGVQLHGDESPEYCSSLREKGYYMVKAFGIDDDFDWTLTADYRGTVDMFVFDTRTRGYGGSGRKFNWDKLVGYDLDIPFLLSGGIGPEDVAAVKELTHPYFAGLDLNSRFEITPGIKSVEKLELFLKQI